MEKQWYCMRCGAEEYRVTVYTGNLETRRCSHCSAVTYASVKQPTDATKPEPLPEPGGVQYQPSTVGGARCPQCGCFPCRVRVTKAPVGNHRVRYHACTDCGWEGKSTEVL